MNHLFPPLLPKEELRQPVLVVAAHPDDEVIGCGAMLAWHRRQGHDVTVVHVSDGAAGDPDQKYEDIAAIRRREGAEALRRLGVEDVLFLDYPDGQLPEHRDAITDALQQLFTERAPKTLYSFFYTEAHRDHRAVAASVAAAAPALPADCRCMLFGVNQVVAGGSMFDVTELATVKEHALASYESQLAYADFKTKTLQRDSASTINIEGDGVRAVEQFAVLRPDELGEVRRRAEALYRYLLRDE